MAGLIAIVSCSLCVLVRFFFSVSNSQKQRALQGANNAYKSARADLRTVENEQRGIKGAIKQLTQKRAVTQKNLKSLQKNEDQYREIEIETHQKIAEQKQLIEKIKAQ